MASVSKSFVWNDPSGDDLLDSSIPFLTKNSQTLAMTQLRYNFRTDWLFYLLVIGYAYLIINMTLRLWFGEGINIFATYSDARNPAEMLHDANKVYWSKTCFLFLTLLLYAFNLDYRFVAGIAASFWANSLILMFGPSPILIIVSLLGGSLIIQQIVRKQTFSKPREEDRSLVPPFPS